MSRLLEHIGSSWPRAYRESGAASAVISSRNAEEERLYGIDDAQQLRFLLILYCTIARWPMVHTSMIVASIRCEASAGLESVRS